MTDAQRYTRSIKIEHHLRELCDAVTQHLSKERRWRKCAHCTMEITQPMIDIVDKIAPVLYVHAGEGE